VSHTGNETRTSWGQHAGNNQTAITKSVAAWTIGESVRFYKKYNLYFSEINRELIGGSNAVKKKARSIGEISLKSTVIEQPLAPIFTLIAAKSCRILPASLVYFPWAGWLWEYLVPGQKLPFQEIKKNLPRPLT
jgi:hypothetical protein